MVIDTREMPLLSSLKNRHGSVPAGINPWKYFYRKTVLWYTHGWRIYRPKGLFALHMCRWSGPTPLSSRCFLHIDLELVHGWLSRMGVENVRMLSLLPMLCQNGEYQSYCCHVCARIRDPSRVKMNSRFHKITLDLTAGILLLDTVVRIPFEIGWNGKERMCFSLAPGRSQSTTCSFSRFCNFL